MSELTLLLLRTGFLALLWLFILWILYALRSDLFGAPARKMPSSDQKQRGAAAVLGAQRDTVPVAPAPVAPTPPAVSPITPSAGALPSAGPASTPQPTSPDGQSTAASMLVITSGTAAGTTMPLDEPFITIGRSTDSTLVIIDEYTSSHHAKLVRSGTQWLLTDLDSTNGTKLNGSRVNGTVLVPEFTPITIGTTTFELRPAA